MSKVYQAHDFIPYRKGIFHEEMEYRTLTILEMAEKDRNVALKQTIKIFTGDQAKAFVFNQKETYDKVEGNKTTDPWQYSDLDLHGRVGVLKYKGIEVAIFVQRQMTKRRINPEHPVSELKLKDPEDAWMRLDLFGLSAKQLRRPTLNLVRDLEKRVDFLEKKNNTLQAIVEQYEAGEKHGR